MKLGLSNTIRGTLAVIGITMFCLSLLSKSGIISVQELFNHPLLIVIAIALFAIALYSDKTGFRGIDGKNDDGQDQSPGASLKKHHTYENSDTDFGGGIDGGGGGD